MTSPFGALAGCTGLSPSAAAMRGDGRSTGSLPTTNRRQGWTAPREGDGGVQGGVEEVQAARAGRLSMRPGGSKHSLGSSAVEFALLGNGPPKRGTEHGPLCSPVPRFLLRAARLVVVIHAAKHTLSRRRERLVVLPNYLPLARRPLE
jgi:hypothetical protein